MLYVIQKKIKFFKNNQLKDTLNAEFVVKEDGGIIEQP